jgi:hypothetical protein
MVIAQIDGGLGNQMFQYALCQSFVGKGVKVKLDISKFRAGHLHNGYELERIFRLQERYCSRSERAVVKSLSKVLHVLFKHPYKEKREWQWVHHPEVNNIRFGFLKGYWQSEKYFSASASIIRAKFRFPVLTDERNRAVQDAIANNNAVSLHIRRGDYLRPDMGCSLDIEYYRNAMALTNEQVIDPYYFIFSDDIEWARENIHDSRAMFIDWNTGPNSFVDMQLMSLCSHNIIANSSFSWWGAWLNRNPSKLVIAPGQWMPGMKDNGDVLPENWTPIATRF